MIYLLFCNIFVPVLLLVLLARLTQALLPRNADIRASSGTSAKLLALGPLCSMRPVGTQGA